MAVYVIAFPSSYFFLFLSVTREGVSRGTRGGDTPPTPCFMASQDNGSGGPEKGGGDVHGQNVPLGTSVDTPSKLTLASSWRWLAALKAEWNGRRKH